MPLSRNSTLMIDPSVLTASAVTTNGTPPSTIEQANGPLTTTSGARPTVTLRGADIVIAPLSSIARATITWLPGAAPLQVTWNGGVGEMPTMLEPSTNSTRTTVPSVSDAVAAREMGAPSPSSAPAAGCGNVTSGGLCASTVIETAADVAMPLGLSYTCAVNE